MEAGRGRGTVYTYSVVHVNDLPPFNERVPYVAAIVELEEGPRVMTNIEGTPFDELRVGMPVVVDFKALDDEIPIAMRSSNGGRASPASASRRSAGGCTAIRWSSRSTAASPRSRTPG